MLPQTPSQIQGYGLSYQWINLSLEQMIKFAKDLVRYNLNCTDVELFGYSGDNWFDKPKEVLDRFNIFCKTLFPLGISIKLTIMNWNNGSGGINMGHSPCEIVFDDNWFKMILRHIKLISMAQQHIWLEPVSEFGPTQRNKACWKKAKEWCNITEKMWNGKMLWNYQSRPNPSSLPNTKWIIDYHTLKSTNCGPSNGICATNTGKILEEFCGKKWQKGANVSNYNSLKRLVLLCKKNKSGFLFCHYKSKDGLPDIGAMKTIGSVVWGN